MKMQSDGWLKDIQGWQWLLIAAAIVVSIAGVGMFVVHVTSDAQIDAQVAALPYHTSTPFVSSTTQAPHGQSLPVKTVTIPAPAVPVHLTCQKAGIDIPVLPLPPEDNQTEVDPPKTSKAVFWNPDYGMAGKTSNKVVLIQAHYALTEYWPFNRLSDESLMNVGEECTVATTNSTLRYRVKATVALTMEQWRASPEFGVSHYFDMILQACDKSAPYQLKRLVGLTLVG